MVVFLQKTCAGKQWSSTYFPHESLPQELMNVQQNSMALTKKEKPISHHNFTLQSLKMSSSKRAAASRVVVPAGNPDPLLTDKDLTCDRAVAESLAETGPMDEDLLRGGKSMYTIIFHPMCHLLINNNRRCHSFVVKATNAWPRCN